MEIKYAVLVGVTAQFVGIAAYILSMVRGTTVPNRATWLMWALGPMEAAAALLTTGATWAVMPVFMSGLGPFLVFIASFICTKSYWRLTRFDYICAACSLAGLLLWAATREPILAIGLAIVADAAAALPTIIKSWRFPQTESVWAYTAGLFSALTGFLAISSFAATEVSFLIYLVLVNLTLISAVRLGLHSAKSNNSTKTGSRGSAA